MGVAIEEEGTMEEEGVIEDEDDKGVIPVPERRVGELAMNVPPTKPDFRSFLTKGSGGES